MLMAIKGVFRAGKIELEERASAQDGTPVVVTFLDDNTHNGPFRMIAFGMLADPSRTFSSEEEFKQAEHDGSEWDRD